MAKTSISIGSPLDDVWAVLADGWMYADWVVGAKHIRAVDAGWPVPGSRFHHTVGAGPLTLRDTTRSEAVDPGRRLVLEARARPLGRARVEIRLHDAGATTQVEMVETVRSPLPARVMSPLFEPLIHARNTESLRRLRDLVMSRGRARG